MAKFELLQSKVPEYLYVLLGFIKQLSMLFIIKFCRVQEKLASIKGSVSGS